MIFALKENAVIAMDVENNWFHVTTDGITITKYTVEQIIHGQHFIDNPEHNCCVCEKAHLIPQPNGNRGRDAQIMTATQVAQYYETCILMNKPQWVVAGALADKVRHETGISHPNQSDRDKRAAKKQSVLAWWRYWNDNSKIDFQVQKWKPFLTEKEKIRNDKLNKAREDSSHQFEEMCTKDYICSEVERAREIIAKAFAAGAVSKDLAEDFGIKWKPKKNRFVFNGSRVMPFYSACFNSIDGNWRCDAKGNPCGINTILFGILQLHHFKCGKGSDAAARAYIMHHRLPALERKYLKDNSLPKPPYNTMGTPLVRQQFMKMNKELVRIFRDYQ